MKTIYVKNNTLKEAVDYLNDEITFFGFFSHIKAFLKQLLSDPINANIDDYLIRHGIVKSELLKMMIERGILEKNTKIININNEDKFEISYKIPKRNFERKIKRLFSSIYEKNEIEESKIFEDGATSCGSCMQGGGLNPNSGQYDTPISKAQRRKIYITDKQSDFLKETTLQNVGNYQYDVPFNYKNSNDQSYNHKGIINSGIPKKTGARIKKK